MKKAFYILLLSCMVSVTMQAERSLDNPLSFVTSDSIVVWGEDRSDFRTTALAIAPELKVREIIYSPLNAKHLKKACAEWNRKVLPSLNVLGGVVDEKGQMEVLKTTEVVKKASRLFLQTRNAAYMDVLERTSLNALMSVLTPGELNFEKHIAAQALMNVSSMIYATDKEGIYVNLYVNNSTHVKTESCDFVIDQLTAMPHFGRVKLRISGLKHGQQPIKIRLRMPDWAYWQEKNGSAFNMKGVPEKLPVIFVNGREEFYKMEKGYLVINRKWNSGDEIYFDFPFTMRYLQVVKSKKNDNELVSLQRGPLVFGFAQSAQNYQLADKTKIVEEEVPNQFGHCVLSVPVKAEDGKSLVLKAQPVMDGFVNCVLRQED